jgi:alpha-ketoglutarate-dependent taurine dioxygenase
VTRTIGCVPLAATVGAEVVGVDAGRLARDGTVAGAVMDALERYGVLVFRGLHLGPEDQVAFARRLGEIDCERGHHPVRGIYRVTLDKSKNASADYLKGTFEWHMDGCTPLHGEPPQKATVLSAEQVAAGGGETEFASTYAAYEGLSEEERERYGSLRVVHTLEASQRRVHPDPSPEQVGRWRERPSSTHPLVWTRRTGRRSLVVGVHADHVVGMDVREGRSLLEDLLARTTAPDRVYRHEWSVGDTVIWDNTGVVHRATPYPPDSPRELLRTTVFGDEPIR